MSKYQKPFLKWVGGKHRIIDKVVRKLPKGERLVEPFVGSGAVFMGTDYDAYFLADNNPDLINLYRFLRDDGEWFIEYVKGLFVGTLHTERNYYMVREWFNAIDNSPSTPTADLAVRAAYFVWLNRHGYNGLCRYNRSGEFNVPFGRYKTVTFPEEAMRAFAKKLQERFVTLFSQSYAETFTWLRPGDELYLDPPYTPQQREGSGFVGYTPGGFGWRDQCYLAALTEQASWFGVSAVMSNHSERTINKLYREHGARLSFFKAPRSVSCANNRKPAREVLAHWEAA